MRGIDFTLQELPGGIQDIEIGFDGDIKSSDTFDTAIIVSLFTDARADESLVTNPELRRGWIGNEFTPGVEMGGVLWVFIEQGRVTRSALNQIEDAARSALQWLVDDGFAVSITRVRAESPSAGRVTLELTIERSPGVTERRFFELWQNTGV